MFKFWSFNNFCLKYCNLCVRCFVYDFCALPHSYYMRWIPHKSHVADWSKQIFVSLAPTKSCCILPNSSFPICHILTCHKPSNIHFLTELLLWALNALKYLPGFSRILHFALLLNYLCHLMRESTHDSTFFWL